VPKDPVPTISASDGDDFTAVVKAAGTAKIVGALEFTAV
jgi:hypothetical protein